MIFPPKLNKGDEIRIVSPAKSLSRVSESLRTNAIKRLTEMGFTVTFAEHATEQDEFKSSKILSRVNDLHTAFADKNVKMILTSIGGFNSNQLLRYLDYELIRNNPKILCGYSDITALHNALFQNTGLVTYSGPHFSTFGMLKGFEYTQEYFQKCLIQHTPFEINPSKEWSDDEWFFDQENRRFVPNPGFKVINPGTAEGTLIGGNLCTFNLLQGTEFMPSLNDAILFLEDDSESKPHHFDRDLQSLIHQAGFEHVKGIVIGRFQNESSMTDDILTKIIKTKKELDAIPVISGADFGHTSPYLTFPIGGRVRVSTKGTAVQINILEH